MKAQTVSKQKQAPKAESSSSDSKSTDSNVTAPQIAGAAKTTKAVKAPKAEVAVAAPVVAVAAPVAAPVAVAAVATATPVQEGGAAPSVKATKPATKAKATKEATPVVAAPPAAVVTQEGAGKKVKQTKEAKPAAKAPKAAKATKAAKEPKAKQAKPTKAAKEPKAKQAKKAGTETADENSEELDGGKRSFKAMLPGSEKFEGRYTGLTPYQAANKALSKYYREADGVAKTGSEITFSIRESTRGSKRSVYTYNGRREKLATPVEYTIKGKDGDRVVKKEFKNRLTKVKKGEAEPQTVNA